jgi:aspartyl-tRNA(Asn)/glutamyl-tRNA(Gln) amidotransferase subunit A
MTDLPTASLRLEQILTALAADDPGVQHVYTRIYAEQARAEARAADQRASHGLSLGPLDGRLVSLKDLLDVAGEATCAGSWLRRQAAPAQHDARVVQALRRAGAVIVGKTNMTEFAFSGVGLNPHYGTPGNACDPSRIPGGSSSGAAVSVARGLAEIAIGSDTGGSIRIPSALNGLVGFKPSRERVPVAGAYPLSYTLDTLGPLARSVHDVACTDSVLAGQPWQALPARRVHGLRLGVPRGLLFTQSEAVVLQAFEQALETLRAAGARVSDEALDRWLGAPFQLQEQGTLVAAEAAHIHARHLAQQAEDLDPLVRSRIERGLSISAAHYVGVLQARQALQAELDQALADFDALLLPTVPRVAPTLSEVEDADAFHQVNALLLRNPSVFNFYDLPALSLPLPGAHALPIGLMLVGRRLADRELLAVAASLESLFATNQG